MKLREWHTRETLRNPAYAAASAEVEFAQSIADRLVEARIVAGLTQGELAVRAGTTQARISELEAGDGNPTTETITKVFKALGLAVGVTVKPIGTEQTEKTKLEVSSTSTEDVSAFASAPCGSVTRVNVRDRRLGQRPSSPPAFESAAYTGIDSFIHRRELVLA